jgi:hypothetical protein
MTAMISSVRGGSARWWRPCHRGGVRRDHRGPRPANGGGRASPATVNGHEVSSGSKPINALGVAPPRATRNRGPRRADHGIDPNSSNTSTTTRAASAG